MLKRRKLLWQLYPSYLIITLLSLVSMAWYATDAVNEITRRETVTRLKAGAVLIQEMLSGRFSREHAGSVDALCKKLGQTLEIRITIMLASGSTLGDSMEDPARMDDHSHRPEVRDALAGKIGVTERQSFTLNRRMMFVALPVVDNGTIIGIVRTAVSVEDVWRTLRSTYIRFGIESLIIVVLAALIGLYVSYRINRPIAAMKEGAIRFARGELDYRLRTPRSEEMADLAEALNSMAAQLHDRLMTVTRQRNELEAVLFSMVEAVLVVDTDERVVRLNRAAKRLLSIKVRDYEGRSMAEVIRNTDLQGFVKWALVSKDPVEARIAVIGDPDRFLQAHGTTLSDAQQHVVGALVVLNDVTRLEKLERIRRDFVANVSHELKTPVTSIKGFLETLKEGAIHDPANAETFLDIIIRQTDRLAMIIEDLLSLSRIERDTEKGEIKIEEQPIQPVLDAVQRSCEPGAREKGIALTFRCEEGLTARIHPPLLEQALWNLVDNAIKYSDSGSAVLIEARREGSQIALRVIDHGTGIPKEHLNRIFERFYRVDKARSRKEGGTGLGLSIAKHIANAHQGRIDVRSSPGQGSTFTVFLPVSPE